MASYAGAVTSVEKLCRIPFASCTPEVTGSFGLNQIGGCVPTTTSWIVQAAALILPIINNLEMRK